MGTDLPLESQHCDPRKHGLTALFYKIAGNKIEKIDSDHQRALHI